MVEGYSFDEINLNIKNFCGFDPNKLCGYKKDFIIAGRFLEDILINNKFNVLDFYVFNETGLRRLKEHFGYSFKERSYDKTTFYFGTNHISIENPDYTFYINLYNAFGMQITDVLEKFNMPTNRCYYDIGKIVFYFGTKELIEKKEINCNPNNICSCLILNAIYSGYSFNQNFYSKLPIKVFPEHNCLNKWCDCYEEEEISRWNYMDCKTDKVISTDYYKMTDENIKEYEEYVKNHNYNSKYQYMVIIKSPHIEPYLNVIMKNSIKNYTSCIYCNSYDFKFDGIRLNPQYKSQYDTQSILQQTSIPTAVEPVQTVKVPKQKPIRYIYRRFVIMDDKIKPIIDKLYEKYNIKETFDEGNEKEYKTSIKLNGKEMESINEVKNMLDTIFKQLSNEGNYKDIKELDGSYSNFISDLYAKGIAFYLAEVQKIKKNPEAYQNFKGEQITTITKLAEFIAEYKFIFTNKLYNYTISSLFGVIIGKFIDLAHNDGLIIPWVCVMKLFPDLVCDEYYPSYNTSKIENRNLSLEQYDITYTFNKEFEFYEKYYEDEKEYDYKPIQ